MPRVASHVFFEHFHVPQHMCPGFVSHSGLAAKWLVRLPIKFTFFESS